ncbi:hypothetical protein B0H19DRAFT_1265147 [Mycena capillaripes]|nr:hypothetical protein B0H19DRAFT_1265147 [Mycena capillaripes]
MSYFGVGTSFPIHNIKGTFVDDGFFQLVQHLGFGRSAEEENPIYYVVTCMHNDVPWIQAGRRSAQRAYLLILESGAIAWLQYFWLSLFR